MTGSVSTVKIQKLEALSKSSKLTIQGVSNLITWFMYGVKAHQRKVKAHQRLPKVVTIIEASTAFALLVRLVQGFGKFPESPVLLVKSCFAGNADKFLDHRCSDYGFALFSWILASLTSPLASGDNIVSNKAEWNYYRLTLVLLESKSSDNNCIIWIKVT